MSRTGIAELPLHPGHCPPWLFSRMQRLGGAIAEAIVIEFGTKELLQRMSDPLFFQALGCVLGFDWHSSGLTTTVCGALKEGIDAQKLGIAICGGKGSVSRKTPQEIAVAADVLSLSDSSTENLIYASRMSAKVDSAAIQDGYQLYHHVFLFDEDDDWAVVQQGMNKNNRYARRYHWLSDNVNSFVEEPHASICAQRKEEHVLNMVSTESKETQNVSLEITSEPISKIEKWLSMPAHHEIRSLSKQTLRTFEKIQAVHPENYETLLATRGVGPAAIRSLALISEVVYGKPPSWQDPAKFSWAHGGKDGIPYPVDRKLYDKSIETLRTAIENAKIGDGDKLRALRNISGLIKTQ